MLHCGAVRHARSQLPVNLRVPPRCGTQAAYQWLLKRGAMPGSRDSLGPDDDSDVSASCTAAGTVGWLLPRLVPCAGEVRWGPPLRFSMLLPASGALCCGAAVTSSAAPEHSGPAECRAQNPPCALAAPPVQLDPQAMQELQALLLVGRPSVARMIRRCGAGEGGVVRLSLCACRTDALSSQPPARRSLVRAMQVPPGAGHGARGAHSAAGGHEGELGWKGGDAVADALPIQCCAAGLWQAVASKPVCQHLPPLPACAVLACVP